MPEELKQPNDGYEKRDMNAGIIILFAAVVLLLTAGALAVTVFIVRGFDRSRTTETAAQPALQLPAATVVRGPELEKDPEAERDAVLVPAREHLNSYGPVSDAPARVHVPIKEAIRLIATGAVPYKRPGAEAVEVPKLGELPVKPAAAAAKDSP